MSFQSKQNLLKLINKENAISPELTFDDVDISLPEVVSVDGRDSKVTLTSKIRGDEGSQVDVTYHRRDLPDYVTGDLSFDAIGVVTTHDYIPALNDRFNLNLLPEDLEDALWHKFVYKGKILFIPDTPTAMGFSYNNMYSYGLVWGTNDNGKFTPNNQSARNQYRTVKKNGYEYIVRLPQAVDGGAYSTTWYNDMTAWLDSEWANTWCRIFRISVPANYPSRVSDRDPRTGSSATDTGCALMQQGYNNQTSLYYRSTYYSTPSIVDNTSSATMYHVFELVLS